MAKESKVQPTKKSYFFSKGYIDLKNTIKGAWQHNGESIRNYKHKLSDLEFESLPKKLLLGLIYILAKLSVIVCGSIITAAITIIHISVLLVFMLLVYLCFSIVWCIDRFYLKRNQIFTACHICKEKSLIPIYLCPNCNAEHTKLTPGVYGILHRTCNCGTKIPTTFFNGRKNLSAICPSCRNPLSDRESRPICIPIIGGRSVGKTAYITAFSKTFIDEVAPAKGLNVEFYNSDKERIYKEIENDYLLGKTRMTQRSTDPNSASSISFSFFVQHPTFKPERLMHIYDIAGEVFTNNNENEVQQQYEYCQGMILLFDPFSVVDIVDKYESSMSKNDIAGIGKADITYILDSFFSKLRMVTGLSESDMLNTPIAIVIGKVDTADLADIVGDAAVNKLMAVDSENFTDYYDTMDYLCRKFLIDNNLSHFVTQIDNKFKTNRYFACSSIGHTKGAGKYEPMGVLAPMEWLCQRADKKMANVWNDISFSKVPAYINKLS